MTDGGRKFSPRSGPVFFVLLAVVFLVYGPVLRGPILGDDLSYVRDHAAFRMGFWDFIRELGSRRYFDLTRESTYQPLVTLFHYFTHGVPLIYRSTGILLHGFNAWLVFLVARHLGVEDRPALSGALLFALFPTHTETLNFSSFKGHLFSFSFSLMALLAWIGGNRALALACCAGSLLSKETGVLTVGLIAAWERCLKEENKQSRRAILPFIAVTAAYLVMRFTFLHRFPVPRPVLPGNPLLYLDWYMRTLVWPAPLCLERTPAQLGSWSGALLLPALIFISRGSPARVLALSWTALGLLPFLRLLPFDAYNPVADRYLYFASAGFCLWLILAWPSGCARALPYALLAAWALVTINRNSLYRDERALARQTVSCAPQSPRARMALGSACLSAGEYKEAAMELETAVSLDSGFMLAWNNLGIARYQRRDYPGSERAFEKALNLADDAPIHNNLGNALAAQNRLDEAYRHYERAWQLQPDWPLPYLNAARIARKKNPTLSRRLELKARALMPGTRAPTGS
ncbi:MAG: tetratricopeptide repeat protein [Elusimicrobia bacterium]|nr:tetratricopeptide repeat protein [Elusimicrobiota bacterium]